MTITARFVANALDLSRLRGTKPALIRNLDYEVILAAALDGLRARLPDVDAIGLDGEPLTALMEEFAYRILVDYGLLNDTVRDVLPAYATGTDLDHIASLAGIQRLQIGVDADDVPIMEPDDVLLMRFFAGFSAPAAGSADAYVGAALAAYPTARDIAVLGPGIHDVPGRIDLVLLSQTGEAVPEPTRIAVFKSVSSDSVRPITDFVSVSSATILDYSFTLTVEIPPGPDPDAIEADVTAALDVITGDRFRIGGEVPRAALEAAGYSSGGLIATASAFSPIAHDPYRAPRCTGFTVVVVERTL
jgi:phage-related baseplate assembly protein